MLRYATVLAICLVASSARAQQASPPSATEPSKAVVAMEEPQLGDHWTYEIHDEITGKITGTRENVVTEVTPKNISLRYKMVGNSNDGLNVYDRSWNLESAPNWRYSPYQGSTGISAPLEVGKSWSFQSNNTDSNNGAIWKEAGTSKVVGQEALTTKAGTFDTFKIETSLTVQSVRDVTKKNEIVFQTWYAPTIDHYVKRNIVSRINKHLRRNDTLELVEYGRKQ